MSGSKMFLEKLFWLSLAQFWRADLFSKKQIIAAVGATDSSDHTVDDKRQNQARNRCQHQEANSAICKIKRGGEDPPHRSGGRRSPPLVPMSI